MNKRIKKFFINCIPIKKIRKELRNKHLSKNEINIHPFAVSSPDSMKMFANYILNWTKIKPENIFEIGANYGQDSAGLAKFLNVPPQHVYCFEAHPLICKEISKLYKFNTFNVAVYNENKNIYFNALKKLDSAINGINTGISSLYKHNFVDGDKFEKIAVPAIRMDSFIENNNIKKIDFLKIDVEGANYEVLDGFGDKLKIVKAIHLESEHKMIWNGQKIFNDQKILLENFNFEMVYFYKFIEQSDSFWVRRDCLYDYDSYKKKTISNT